MQRDPDVGDSAEGLLKKIGVVEGMSDVSWHKDCSLGGHSRGCSSLTVGISVTGAGRENGELGVVAGSRRANVPVLGVDGLDLPRVPLPTRTGDVTVHCSCTLHMSRPPVSAERRVVYTGFDLAPRPGDRPVELDPAEIRRRRAALDDNSGHLQGEPERPGRELRARLTCTIGEPIRAIGPMGGTAWKGVDGRTVRNASVTLVGLVLASALVLPGSVVSAGAATVERPEGAGPPVAASGMGTQAALDNPRCRHDDPTYGPYGRFDTTSVGGGPACVKAWKEGADNGGATAQGVTKDRVKVVFVLPNEEQFKSDPVKPVNRASNTTGTYQDGLNDYLIPELRFYETWGRDLEAHFYTSSGSDEQSQRSDIVAIKAMKPFAVANLISGQNLKVLETGLAAAKILTQGYSASYADSAKQSPYLWGSADNNATAINSAEVLGKQLVGKKAEFGGDDVAGQTRKIGVVSDGSIDDALFVDAFREFGGKVTTTATVPIESDALQAAVPPVITRLKSAGVTTIVMFAGSDAVQALMETASKQDYFPEWFFTGASYQDIGILARNYPPDQSQHTFGISFINPSTKPDPATEARTDAVTWYWGPELGTYSARYVQQVTWLLSGIHAAGPNLTPKTFKQGLFALPANGGAATWTHRHLDEPGSPRRRSCHGTSTR